MAYDIKLLRDEDNKPFMPITAIKAVRGRGYVTTILTGEKDTDSHYNINCDELTETDVNGSVIGLKINEIGSYTIPSFLSFNHGNYYPIYQSDGINFLDIGELGNAITFVTLDENRWVVVKTGGTSSGGGSGHTITADQGSPMINRLVLDFSRFNVFDSPGTGATRVVNPNYSSAKRVGITGLISPNTWVSLSPNQTLAPENGVYRIIIQLELNDITTAGREIGVKVSNHEKWSYQYKRFNHTFIIQETFLSGDDLTPSIYIDKISSTDTINIENCGFYIERVNIQNWQEVANG